MNRDRDAPTWSRWLATARSIDPGIPDTNKAWDLSFREELHAIDAVAAGQGIAMFSDVVVGRELNSETHELNQVRERMRHVQRPAPRYTTGVFAKYAALVSSASDGAVTRPGNLL